MTATPATGKLVVISGPSGVGKTTITRGLAKAFPDSALSVSVTTRTPGPGDREGVDYFFISREEFDRLVRDGRLLEHAEVFGNAYGTPRQWVEEQLREGRLVLLEIDVQGARQVRAAMPEALGIFILPPSEDELLRRLRLRRRDTEEVIQRRFAEAKREIAEAKSSGAYDAYIVNRDLEQAIDEAVRFVRRRRAG
jgi:guanylate kinase